MSAEVNQALDAMDVLAFTRRKRIAVVETLMADETAIKEGDPKMLKLALAALDGIDRQELGLRKIDATEKGTQADRMVAEALTELLGTKLGATNPFEAGQSTTLPEDRTAPLPELALNELMLVPGETDVGLSTDNLTSFAQRTGIRTDAIAGMGEATASEEFERKTD